ncbi:hypothetical protein [Photobacterium sp. J15]|nr:hypothetical protein [Photobacterium sp. J15]
MMGIKDYEKVFNLALLMLGFYIVFAFNNIIDSYFWYWAYRPDAVSITHC